MHDTSSVEFHKEGIDLRKQESKLMKLLSIPRRKLDQEELVESLRDVRGEIDSLESELHGKRQGKHTIDRFNPQWVCRRHYDRWNDDRDRFLADRLGCQKEEL